MGVTCCFVNFTGHWTHVCTLRHSTANRVKILPTKPDAYRKSTKLLETLNAKFHTYQLKQETPFRVVLRNIHHSVDLDELKFELLKHGHEVTNISNIRHRVTKNPLSLFFIDTNII